MAGRPLTILFMPESAYGPTGNCMGIGDVLQRRGHRVVFAAESSWSGKLSTLGFVEDLVDLAPPDPAASGEGLADEEQDAGQFWKDFIKQTAPEFRKPTVEQLATFMQPTWQALIDGAKYCEPQLRDIIARTQPDVIVEDNVVGFPALLTSDAPFVRIVSCNPLEIKGPGIAPTYSGLPADDSSEWESFRREYDRTHRPMWEDFNAFVQEQGGPPLADLEFIHESQHANLYVYPQEADYTDRRPLGKQWHRLDSSVRTTDDSFTVPPELADRPADSGLIYLSLGSLGSADVDLMKRLVAVLGQTKHRYIVSKGPQHAEYELADNMWGAEFVPQTTLMPLVDLVITHGGNNTTTEAFHFGKPLVVLPLFWDQYDNAQRVHELGFGRRLPTYSFRDNELISAVDELLADHTLRAKLADMGAAIRSRSGKERAADVIESVAKAGSATT
ncbi:MAG TPA: nucleotide disphospho-sugar-binding domain-containing protein [Actinomycetes bacterium]|nr:nucleotide disphospho-sugar-binding domain-containing protein [Actinomycetes bacterium]